MKSRPILLVVCLVIAVFLIVRHIPRGGLYAGQHSPGAHSANANAGLRSFVLQSTRANFGLGPAAKPTQPYAVVMDWGRQDGVTTVVAIADGSASVYLSKGGGSIGGGQSHDSIRNAALKMVQLAGDVQPLMQHTTEYPLPQRGQVNFYAVTDTGVFTSSVPEESLNNGGSPFGNLSDAGEMIITEYRRIEREKPAP